MDISYAMLSGGKAKRFGSDKTKALYKEKPLYIYGLETGLKVSCDVMHISKDAEKYKPFLENVRYIQDDLEEICPMSGLIKAAEEAKHDDIFAVSADAPLITWEFIKFLYIRFKDCDGVIPVINGKSYTLMSFYKRDVLQAMIYDYKNKNYKIIKSLERGIVDIETLKTTNANLISTLDEVLKIQEEGRQGRKQAELELNKIEEDLKNKLMGLADKK